ncbi:MAG: HpcH/HpaI aldolase/citrate lyase family protein [Sandaracinobacter sp.]
MTDFPVWRSLLYLPASNARAVEKARGLPADAVILDLEDAVAPDAKADARAAAVAAVGTGFGGRPVGIRVNGFGTDWSDADFAAVAASAAAFLVVPKINGPQEAARAVAGAGGKPVFAMIETPRAVQQVDAIADVAGVGALVAGFADLQKDLRARPGPDRGPLLYAASRIVNGARASGLLAFDGVFTGIGDADGLAREARQAVEFGFDGKTCIHPSQLEGVNRAFSPSDAEVAHARGLLAAHAAAMAEGKAVATFKGRMVEVLHVLEAKRTLRLAELVGEMGGLAEQVIEVASD